MEQKSEKMARFNIFQRIDELFIDVTKDQN